MQSNVMEARSEQERFEAGIIPRELDPEIIKAILKSQIVYEVQEVSPEE